MNSDRRTAIVAGILFIIATVASLLGTSFTGPILGAQDYLVRIASNGNQVAAGALLEFIAAAGSASIAMSLYPILKKHHEGLALGAVGFRLIEGVFYIVGAICLLSLFAMSQEFVSAGGPSASYFQTLGHLLLTARNLAVYVFGVLAFCVGALIYYAIFYQTQSIPRWLSAWGLLAIASLLSAALLTMFSGGLYSISGGLLILVLPIALQEMVLAVWLIVKGFTPSAVAFESAKTDTNASALRTSRI